MANGDEKHVDRRKFLLGTAAVAVAGGAAAGAYLDIGAGTATAGPPPGGPGVLIPNGKVALFRRLGRTNLKVSAVGIGAGSIRSTKLLARAVDKGMNYIDTSICYGDSELVIGRALRESPGLRDKLLIATKWDAGATMPKERILESLDKSLKRLGVDVIDIMQVHWLGGGHLKHDDGFNRLANPALYEAMAEAKKAGKVKFFGATSHDGNRGKILEHAIDKGAFDMILVKMNVLDSDAAGIPSLLKKAKEKDVGVVVMKSQPEGGHIPPGFEKSRFDIYQANLRWVLQHEVACVVHSSIGTDEKRQDLAVGAAQEKYTESDHDLLRRYATALSPEHCRGCGQLCEPSCPNGVAIAPILHFAMYAKRLGWTDYARELYAELPPESRWSDRCGSCRACADACPYGIDAPARLAEARKILG